MSIIFVSPDVGEQLRTMTPRARWKAQDHARRYERRYGKPPLLARGILGTVQGVRIVVSGKGLS